MRRMRMTTAAIILTTALAAATAGCGRSATASAPPTVRPSTTASGAAVSPAAVSPAAVSPAAASPGDIYAQVLRRYLGTPAENSFPGKTFKTVYVLNQAYADAADPTGSTGTESLSRPRRSAR